MKKILKQRVTYVLCVMIIILTPSCSFDEVVDPNAPSVDSILQDATIGQLNELVVGVEASARNGHAIETTSSGTMARELYLFDADPRNTGDLLGKDGIVLDNNSFYSVAQWNGNYRCIKNANLLIQAVNNTASVTEMERNGYMGFAKTIIAYKLIQVVKSYGQARIDVVDEDNLGPLVDEATALTAIRTMLDDAQTDLSNASFIFSLSNGFDGFNDVVGFTQFNRAVSAMAAVYDGDSTAALTALSNSYFSLTESLTLGPKHVFSNQPNDVLNGLFKAQSTTVENQNNGDNIIIHNSWIDEADANDNRVTSKSAVRPDQSAALDDLNGSHETRLYASATSSIDILRNEELILLYAEANISSNIPEAINALNVIRNAAGVGNYTGASTVEAVTTEMLKQRRYSLWCENHRMYDLRRYNLSNTLPIDRSGDQIFNVFPIPLSENL
jgi:hypothetical protein